MSEAIKVKPPARNRAECLKCGQVVESTSRHHFSRCQCGNIAVDGGTAYYRRLYKSDQWRELPDDEATT